MAGENLEKHPTVKDVLIDMGIYFQVQDDYLDCFGEPEKIGKIGTDIEDFKCSWLVVKALELCNEEQKKTLLEHYGKDVPADVAKIKVLYNELNLQGVQIYRNFYSEEKERSNGVVAIYVQIPTSQLRVIMASILSGLRYDGIQKLLGFVETVGTNRELLPPPTSTLLSTFRSRKQS